MLNVYSHLHTNFSYDGRWPLEKVASAFRKLGADILLVSEHSQRLGSEKWKNYRGLCKELSNEKIRIIAGVEYSTPKNCIHFPTWGIEEYLGEELEPEKILEAARSHGAWCILAHPERRAAWNAFDSAWPSKGLCGVEVWNRKTDGLTPSSKGLELASNHSLTPVASVDFHGPKQLYPLYNKLNSERSLIQESDCEIIRHICENGMTPVVFGLDVLGRTPASLSVLYAHRGLEFLRRIKNRRRKKAR